MEQHERGTVGGVGGGETHLWIFESQAPLTRPLPGDPQPHPIFPLLPWPSPEHTHETVTHALNPHPTPPPVEGPGGIPLHLPHAPPIPSNLHVRHHPLPTPTPLSCAHSSPAAPRGPVTFTSSNASTPLSFPMLVT